MSQLCVYFQSLFLSIAGMVDIFHRVKYNNARLEFWSLLAERVNTAIFNSYSSEISQKISCTLSNFSVVVCKSSVKATSISNQIIRSEVQL
jgi:hypothetical protein